MQLIFDDNGLHLALAPFTLTRPVAEIRFGIRTIAESWVAYLNEYVGVDKTGYATTDYLAGKYPTLNQEKSICIAGNIKPTDELARWVAGLTSGQALYVNDEWIATHGTATSRVTQQTTAEIVKITTPWHIFQRNKAAFLLDFEQLTKNRTGQRLNETNRISGDQIFIEEGATVNHAILNASEETGPIYIGKNAEIMEGAVIRGPFALCEGATVKMAAKIYGATTIGPFCKVGGEISNCIFQAYSNKGHDGFLGNSVIGEWCNLGADTNSSNLKNNYSNVKIHRYTSNTLEATEVMFCGLLMGDHSKTGINTMLNTATVVGVSANIFGGNFPPKFIPSFTWGGIDRNDKFKLDKAFEVAENMMKRRNVPFTEEDRLILTHLYQQLA